jgi:hypothetical protein
MSDDAQLKAETDQLLDNVPTPEDDPSLEEQLGENVNGSETTSQLLDDVNDAIQADETVNVSEEVQPKQNSVQEQQIEEIIILNDKVQKLRIRQDINEIMLKMHKSKATDASVHARLKRAEAGEGDGGMFGFCAGDRN